MIFDITKNIGVWFDFPGGGRVQLRAPSVEDVMRISKESTEIRPFLFEQEGKAPRVLNQEIPDLDKQSRLYNDCAILAWEGFFDANETEIPCTAENKTLLMRLDDPAFRDFVNEKVKALSKATEAEAAEAEKNSVTG